LSSVLADLLMEYYANDGDGSGLWHEMRHPTGADLANWALKAAGVSCSTTSWNWFQSLTVLTAN